MTRDLIPSLSEVALLRSLPEHGLLRGQVGAVVEKLGEGVYEVEFSDHHGRTYALAPVCSEDLMPLVHEPAHPA